MLMLLVLLILITILILLPILLTLLWFIITDDDRINYCFVDDVHNDDTSTSDFHSATAYAKLLHTARHDGIADTNTDLPDAARNGDAAKQLTETAETVENPNLLNLLIVTEGFTQRPATC